MAESRDAKCTRSSSRARRWMRLPARSTSRWARRAWRSRLSSSSPTTWRCCTAAATNWRRCSGVLRALETARRRAAGRGDAPGQRLPRIDADRAQEPGRGTRCADARHGAVAHLSGSRAGRRPRHGAGAAAAAERPACRARQPAAVRRHAAVAEPEVRSAAGARAAGAGRTSS